MNTSVVGDLAGELLGGRYQVVKPVARGGMATVYLATDTKLQRGVAIKVLKPALAADPEFLERFKREAQSTAKLWHPNVVAVFDWEVDDHPPYLVLEYVPGHTLRDVLNHQRLSASQALAVLDPVLEALIAAHDGGIIHRDIKPENVLIGPRHQVKVADFGLARAHDDHSNHTRSGMVMATPAYMSPEQVRGVRTGTASDIYSTGILLFEMLTGQQPFTGDNAASVAFQHINNEVPRPSSLVPGLPTEVDELLAGATDRDEGGRFPTARAFLDEVRRVRGLMPPAEPLPVPSSETNDTVILDPSNADALEDEAADDDVVRLTGALVLTDDELVAAPRRRRRGRRIALSLVVVAALIGGLAWALLAGPLQRATVPNLVGLAQADAEALLSQSNLRLQVSDQQFSETAPKGTVISQDPAAEAGTFVRFAVAAVISLGPERYVVPDVTGKSVDDATAALTATKLVVGGTTTAFDESVAQGLVASTDPPVNASLKPQTPVTLIVSNGPAPRPVPDVSGKSADEAKAAIEGAGLVFASKEDYSEQVPAGQVSAMDPQPGTEVAKGATVTVTMSKGPPPVEVPRVVDMKRNDAVNKLKAAGFQVKIQEGIVTPLDRVYSQDPVPGEMLPKGSTVTISIF